MRPLLCLLLLSACSDPFRGSPAFDDGSRVSVRFLEHAGGARAALGLFDAQRGTRCAPRLHHDGSTRCLPDAITLRPGLFATNTCEGSLATFVPSTCSPTPAEALFQAGSEEDDCGDIPTWVAYATTTPLPELFEVVADLEMPVCETAPTPSGMQAVGIGAEITSDLFVAATLETLPVTSEVDATVWALEDGARFGVSLLHDGVTCQAEPFADGTTRCVPSRGMMERARGVVYADPTCQTQAWTSRNACDGAPDLLVVRDERGRVAQVRGLDGPAVRQAYADDLSGGGCRALDPQGTPFGLRAVGDVIDSSTFPALSVVVLGDDTLTATWVTDTSGDIVASAGPAMRMQAVDGSPACAFGLDPLGQVWCVDDRLLRQNATTQRYLDSACEAPVWVGIGGPPLDVLVVESDASCPDTQFPVTWRAVYRAGRAVTEGTTLHQRDASGSCVAIGPAPWTAFRAWTLERIDFADVGERLGLAVQY